MIIMCGLVLYNALPTPKEDADQSVFTAVASFWYNYVHSLFCE